ncbi:hypothetical protein [Rickettsia endosymbiont of Polydrusus tereticollis]|uniref:hypothetical protein n=1 Tax=Rickettsia endosymbiont of Polydrusus tereticollis TaxID=3066251 RepID=UPI0031334B28
MNTPNIEPTSFTVGETVQWQKEIVNYSPKDGWQLVYCFRNFAYRFEVKAQAENNYYVIRLSSEETSKYKPAIYWWQSRIIKEEMQYVLENGEFVIKPNLALLDSYDGRSHVKQVLDALEATILGKASRDQLSYSISSRSLSRLSPTELLKWRDVYKAEYARNLQEEQLSKGLSGHNLIKIRFGNPL